jgi:hypothetical protein
VGSDATQGMGVCLHFFCVLPYPEYVMALQQADPLSKDSYLLSTRFILSEFLNAEWEHLRKPNPLRRKKNKKQVLIPLCFNLFHVFSIIFNEEVSKVLYVLLYSDRN